MVTEFPRRWHGAMAVGDTFIKTHSDPHLQYHGLQTCHTTMNKDYGYWLVKQVLISAILNKLPFPS